ncbi:AcrR family transcriptional regulator [Kitasatospora sp. GAS204A]|uniref:TetR/AcrR family transcriptional regulator n=1 Tax=unclassified Kitasatospora TaxID=2633591 RepID=UPI0024762DC4|nr:TetR/AcrR family transcriptional regulator [Kitasatospora sp. GAS204B]MDH6121825.1 AcrR family transcriptional regulator [Kitasatospora sp. GAS204B]
MTSGSTTPAPVGSQRADARRNRAHILTVAHRLLAADGMRVSFDDLALHAGVGVGTVYRHFPTKNDLFRAVLADGIRVLTDEARRQSQAGDPAQALLDFFRRMTEQAMLNKALCEGLESLDGDPGLRSAPEAERDFLAALGELLARAQATGAIRTDLDAADVRALVVGAATTERVRADSARPGRLAALHSAILRADPPGSRPLVTNRPGSAAFHNESGGSDHLSSETFHNETGSGTEPGRWNETPTGGPVGTVHCEVCGRPLRLAPTGRRARFCGAACRQKAHRQRHGNRVGTP